jgi:hypothetical protein
MLRPMLIEPVPHQTACVAHTSSWVLRSLFTRDIVHTSAIHLPDRPRLGASGLHPYCREAERTTARRMVTGDCACQHTRHAVRAANDGSHSGITRGDFVSTIKRPEEPRGSLPLGKGEYGSADSRQGFYQL